MAIVDLGKITFVNKGAWNKATNYEIKDIISYNGSSWASLKNGNIGNEPKEGVNWTLMVKTREPRRNFLTLWLISRLIGNKRIREPRIT